MTEMVPTDRLMRSADPLPRAPELSPPLPKTRRAFPVRRLLGLVALIAALAGGAYFGHAYWTDGRFLVSTDDAYIKADMATLSAKVGGYVNDVPVVENQTVRKGDVIAVIDPVDYRLAVAAAKSRIDTQDATIARLDAQTKVQRAMIDQTRAMQTSAEADQTRAVAEFGRANDLIRSSYGTPQRLDQARADRDRAVASVANAQAQVAAADANLAVMEAQRVEARRTKDELGIALDRAQRDYDFATVRAPFDGIVGNKAVQPGMLVQAGTRLLTLVPPETAYVEANFKETQIGRLRPGQHVRVRLDARSDRAIDGIVESFAPASGAQFSMLPPENATGNFTKIVQRLPVRIKLPVDATRDGFMSPGLSVVVDVDTRTGPDDRTAQAVR